MLELANLFRVGGTILLLAAVGIYIGYVRGGLPGAAAATIGTIAYLLPSIVAVTRGHPQVGPIVVVNFFFGWTILGWIWALAGSFGHIRESEA